MNVEVNLKPQKGPQEQFLYSNADIAVYGGAAGGGKTYALLLEALRHINNTNFRAVFFRRISTSITAAGSILDTSKEIYRWFGGVLTNSPKVKWTFRSGAQVQMSHLNDDETVKDWQGSQVAAIFFDELCEFTREQFFFMLSRNRSTCGVKPYVRATCNPDPDSWVAEFISWWIDQETGYPIPERSGAARYFLHINNELFWANSPQELIEQHTDFALTDVKSVSFIAARLEDNQELLQKDPSYISNLKAMSKVNMERFLKGNWKIRAAAGNVFKREEVEIISILPTGTIRWVRRWDLAATEPSETNPDPDYTAGVLMGKTESGKYVVADVQRGRWKASAVRQMVKNTAAQDAQQYGHVTTVISQDPGQAGKEQAESYVRMLDGYDVRVESESGSKIVRAEPFAAQWQNGQVQILVGEWNGQYFYELEIFPDGRHDDQVDASSNAYSHLARGYSYDMI
jgi:predicted phage terminase large subunit-like protein